MTGRWLASAFAGWICGASVIGADASVPASVRVEMQMVSVSVPEARVLVPQLQDAKTAQRTFDRVQEMIAQDRAVLVGWPIGWLRCGPSARANMSQGVSETIEEVRYPAEWDPPLFPQTFGGRQGTDIHWGPSNPTAFNTRNTGTALEAEATVEDGGRIIALNLIPQVVRFLNFKEHRIAPSPWGISGVRYSPDFFTQKMTSSFRVVHDRPTLVGVFVVDDPKPHVDLFILRARASVIPPEAVTVTPP